MTEPPLVFVFREAIAGREVEPGQWRALLVPLTGRYSAVYACPSCERICTLEHYQITAEGHVAPRLLCVTPTCRFLREVRLEGWSRFATDPSASGSSGAWR